MNRFSVRVILLLALLVQSALASAWWNDDWSFRKQIQVDVSGVPKQLADGSKTALPVVVRLHAGNFSYFGDVMPKAEDLRFIAGDDKTALNFHIEKYDPIAQMALIWVYMPYTDNATTAASLTLENIWMYYGNQQATSAADRAKTYPVNYGLVYHFDQNGLPTDAGPNGNNPSAYTSEVLEAGLIAKGAQFKGSNSISVPVTPSIALSENEGWTLSMWIKPEGDSQKAVLAEIQEGKKKLQLRLDGLKVTSRYSESQDFETAKVPTITSAAWHHVGMHYSNGKLVTLVDGKQASNIDVNIPAISGYITIGSEATGTSGFTGFVDEINVVTGAFDPLVFERLVESQNIGSTVVSYGGDESAGSDSQGTDYFTAILNNVSIDGWTVIIALAAMFSFSLIIIISKSIVLSRTHKDNVLFLQDYRQIDPAHPEALDRGETEDEKDLEDAPVMQALFGKHDHYQSSSLYRLYHIGMQGLTSRLTMNRENCLSPQSIDAIKASLDAALVREQQKLNRAMVILTIAISGGPFLGLLGTVLGVMITFAAIAVSGDVNINAIAPGVSAALMTTVAGLAVAIPALFAYNYLSTKIRDLTVDMRVFVDELVARIAEFHN